MIGKIVIMFIGCFIAFSVYFAFIWTPVSVYAEAKCLEKGYPESRVTIGLSVYCMTLDGAVTVNVDKL